MVFVNKSLVVDGEVFVWVDSYIEKIGVGLQKKEREINVLVIFMILNSYMGLVCFCYEQLLIIFDFQVLNIGFIIKYVYGKVLKLIDFDLLYLREMF